MEEVAVVDPSKPNSLRNVTAAMDTVAELLVAQHQPRDASRAIFRSAREMLVRTDIGGQPPARCAEAARVETSGTWRYRLPTHNAGRKPMPFANALLASGGSWIALSPGSPLLRAHARGPDEKFLLICA